VKPEQLGGTIQTTSSRIHGANTYIYPPSPSLRIISDIFAYARRTCEVQFDLISGYNMQEAGATQTSSSPIRLRRRRICPRRHQGGLDVDRFRAAAVVLLAIGMNFFMEVPKLRAARCSGPS